MNVFLNPLLWEGAHEYEHEFHVSYVVLNLTDYIKRSSSHDCSFGIRIYAIIPGNLDRVGL